MLLNLRFLDLFPASITSKVNHSYSYRAKYLSEISVGKQRCDTSTNKIKMGKLTNEMVAPSLPLLTECISLSRHDYKKTKQLHSPTLKGFFDFDQQAWQFLNILITTRDGTRFEIFPVLCYFCFWSIRSHLVFNFILTRENTSG